ncbi:MAG: glycosyltransferase family 39 protein [Candidatus Acidiferrum sp.]
MSMFASQKSAGILAAVSATLFLALMALLAGGAALRESVTVDEVAHIGAGVSYLQKFDLRMNPEHPPLPKMLAAIPLALRGVHADYNHISWTYSEKFFGAALGEWAFGEWLLDRWNEPTSVLAWARLPMLLLTLALGWVIYVYAKRLGGVWGGLLSLCVYASTPAFLTFGPLVHTDVAVTLFCLTTLWAFAEVCREPSRRNVALFALSFAAALLSKFTAGILLFAFVAFAWSLHWRGVPGQPQDKAALREWRRTRMRATWRGILWVALAVYAFYFVFSWNQPTNALYKIGRGPAALLLRRLLFPILLYLRGLFWVLASGVRATFLLGHNYSHGVWFYFPVVFALKSAIGFLILLVMALAVAIGRKLRGGERVSVIPEAVRTHWRALWVGLLVFTGICLLSQLDISIRHFSVPMVLLIVLLAPLPRMVGEWSGQAPVAARIGGVAIAVLAASCVFTALRAYPYYFPYINALGLQRPAYTLVNDSNVDWNQSLPEVERFAIEQGLAQIRLDAYTLAPPRAFVPQAQVWDCQQPKPSDMGQWAVLSANLFLDGKNCAWLLQYPHQALAKGSMYAVHLPEVIPPPGGPGGPPLPSEFRYIGGAKFDPTEIFMHVQEHPEDLPAATEWMMNLFKILRETHGHPAKLPPLPWEQ